MNFSNLYSNNWQRSIKNDDGDDDEPREAQDKRDDLLMLNKRLEKLFFDKRAVYLWGVVDDKSAREITTKLMLLEADKPDEEIKFYINSPGGVVTSGMVIYDTMKMISSPVSTICMGLAASMGSILLSGGEKGKRFIYPHGEVMIHQPSLGGFIRGVSSDLEIQAKQTQRVKEIGARILADNCGKTIDQIMIDFDRDYWMDANEAIAYGIADKVMDKL
ncbi:MAG TPA: ATP-dependent Clp protease proteolytic subunit [Niabella sp.]|nr:ATP-dependent Clp protease proteolytic subunit [Niabella sp.]HQW14184.1 ATP-dependent Clp protease proteolytic subunit [Niabella sp.]HQX19584.1 ATP-dependent Clp protease proteolytic subunit [Niabella sp.]HQX39982.1 ATP-dependent Clp protease proteolytic subunit [Niabella sp.]HRB06976.1 ATP-dependent Clp protease proteolytic subunit [Niabella sp.]